MKTTFKDIAHHYLPYKAPCVTRLYKNTVPTLEQVKAKGNPVQYIREWIIDGTVELVAFDCGWATCCAIELVVPLLRPLSSLTQEIEVNGERFVPLTKLIALYRELAEKYPPYMEFTDMLTSLNTGIHEMPFWIVQQLLAWHFNCFSLDESEFIAITH